MINRNFLIKQNNRLEIIYILNKGQTGFSARDFYEKKIHFTEEPSKDLLNHYYFFSSIDSEDVSPVIYSLWKETFVGAKGSILAPLLLSYKFYPSFCAIAIILLGLSNSAWCHKSEYHCRNSQIRVFAWAIEN